MIIQLTQRNKKPILVNTKLVVSVYPSDDYSTIIMRGGNSYYVIESITEIYDLTKPITIIHNPFYKQVKDSDKAV